MKKISRREAIVLLTGGAGWLALKGWASKAKAEEADRTNQEVSGGRGDRRNAPKGDADSSPLSFEWVISKDRAEDLRSQLAHDGADLVAQRDFIPSDDEKDDYAHSGAASLTVIAGVLTAVYLVDRIIGWLRSAKHHGLIIDARGRKLLIKEHPSVDRGTVIVVDSSGTHQFNSNQQAEIQAIIEVAAKSLP